MCKKHTATFSYQSRKRGNPEVNLQFNVGLTIDASIQRRRMFLHALIRSSVVNRIPPAYPSYSGFYTSLTKPLTKHKTYYHVTLPNQPKKGVVYDITQRCKQAAEEKSMPFIQLIGDQPVYALIVEVKNENQGHFENILPVLGGSHTQGAFMATIYGRFKGSGLEDLAVAAGIVEAGSTDQALKGKHHKRGMRLHKLMYECLARLLISSTTDDLPTLYSEPNQLSNQVFDSDQYIDAFEDLFTNTNFQNLVQASVERIDITNSPKARFWLSYMEMVEILYMHYHAMRTQNWEEYLTSIRMMLPWLFAYNSFHYSRYLSLYWSEINNLDEEKAFYMRSGLFSASMSGRPFSALRHDEWIEMRMNKGSKMKCGWIGITHKEEALQVNKVINNIKKAKESLKEVANIKKRQYSHIECSSARMIKDVKTVEILLGTLQEWNANPWNTAIPFLRSLESGLLASEELVKEFDSAKKKEKNKQKSSSRKEY